MNAPASGGSISDAAGNLLFYTNGITVWNASHTVMPNGNGLSASSSTINNTLQSTEGVMILKKPGSSSIYYVISQERSAWNASVTTESIYYSTIDMSLASGQGSVTTKAAVLYTGYTSGRIAATKHCNGSDIWFVTREWFNTLAYPSTFTPNYRAYLLTSAGISTNVVLSPGSTLTYTQTVAALFGDQGFLKFSPNGKKLAVGNYGCMPYWLNSNPIFEVFDFDNNSGLISNQLTLYASAGTSTLGGGMGVEFSPDGTKLYGTQTLVFGLPANLFQWNLCAGTGSAIAGSVYSVSSIGIIVPIQLAADAKIYGSRAQSPGVPLAVVNNPNLPGSGCNINPAGQSVSPFNTSLSLPLFVSNHFYQPPPTIPFTYSLANTSNCASIAFTSAYSPGGTVPLCPGMGIFTVTAVNWTFGDPASGSANNSFLANPVHLYSAPGIYTTQLVLYYSCGGGTDTIKQAVIVNGPTLSFNTSSITCANFGSATVSASGGTGPFTYTWMPSNLTGTIVTGLTPGTKTITLYDAGLNCSITNTVYFAPLIPLTGSIAANTSITCNGANTATGSISNLAGGSGTQTYLWTNGSSVSSLPSPTNLSAGVWSVNVTDALTACQVNSVLTITQPPTLTLNISSSSPSACAGTNITFTASNSGGTPAYTYTWVGAGSTTTITVSQALAGNYVYTVNSRDANLCLSTKTIAGNFVPNPTLAVSNVSICPFETGTLTVSGASFYTWNASLISNTYTAAPISTQQYSVIGSALGCSAAATASIIVKPVPSPTVTNNSPICNALNLNLTASGGASYLWAGPLSFISSVQNPTISSAAPANSGVYNVTVTGVNSCTAPASTTVVVNPTPTISLTGGGVCVNSSLYLSANSFTGSSYLWAGPNSFSSSLQNPTITAVSFSAIGIYSLLVTSSAGCNNAATMSVIVNPLPSVSIAPSSTVICVGKTANLSASGASTYTWNTGAGQASYVVSPTVNSTYTVTGTDLNGCKNFAIQSISVNALPILSVSASPSVYCAGGSSTLTVNGANTFTWSTAAQTNSIAVSPMFTSFYSVRGTDAITTCSNTAALSVSVNPLPVITASTTESIICTGISATLMAGGGTTYTWTPLNLNTATVFPIPLVTTIYTLTGTNTLTGCSNIALKTISVNITPTLNLVSNTPTLCAGWSAVLTPSGASIYTLMPGNLTGTSFSITPSTTTQYSLSGTNSVNCVNLSPTNLSIIVYSLTAIAGVVTSTTGQTNGNVVLYKYKPYLSKWDSINTSLVIVSNYNFPSVPVGTYVVKSFPFPTDLIETYGLSSSSWQSAALINHNCYSPSIQNINIITINNNLKSKATLSGKITQGPGYSVPGSPGAGIPNIIVKAGTNPGAIMVQRSRTNSQGQYTLTNLLPNLPNEHYYILVDIPGLDTNGTYHRIIITGFENFTNLDFTVDSARINPLNLTVGIKNIELQNANFKVYPNPASNQIHIEFDLKTKQEISIDLFDVSGRKVKTILEPSEQMPGELSVLAGISDVSKGIYLLNVQIGGEKSVVKLVVEE
ncbi:MAG: T9SS type A sorting domain-containing protein [bacterium]|nr:T9SS type A sorting domain-containing protein [bacterium]